jgi:hypothetical protein
VQQPAEEIVTHAEKGSKILRPKNISKCKHLFLSLTEIGVEENVLRVMVRND